MVYPDARVKRGRFVANLRGIASTQQERLLFLFGFAKYWSEKNNVVPDLYLLISPWAVLSQSMSPAWAGNNVEFAFPWNFKNSILFRWALAFYQFLAEITHWPSSQPASPPSIAIAHFMPMDKMSRYNELHWWWESGIPAKNLILYFDRRDEPASRTIVERANQLGIRCVVVHKDARGDYPSLFWQGHPGVKTSIIRLIKKIKILIKGVGFDPVRRWLVMATIEMLFKSERMEDFIREFNVCGLFHYQAGGLDWVSMACDAAGAVRFSDQRSHAHWPCPTMAITPQVYFLWGSHDRLLDIENQSYVEQRILSGCIIRGAAPNQEPAGETVELKNRLHAAGATYVLTLLDNAVPCDRFYEFFLNKVLADARWGLLIKPKNMETLPWLRKSSPILIELFERVRATNRVVVAPPLSSPCDAAAVSDFTVGIDVNTGTVCAGLAGLRAAHMDYLRMHESLLSEWAEFYRAGPDSLVFDNPEKLWRSINDFVENPSQFPILGIMNGEIQKSIDPFRDGLSSKRIGEYVRWYLNGIENGLGRDATLEQTGGLYAKKYGKDKVEGSYHGIGAS
jgi:hypothetical protein